MKSKTIKQDSGRVVVSISISKTVLAAVKEKHRQDPEFNFSRYARGLIRGDLASQGKK